MRIPEAALRLIREAEGLRLRAYRCPAGVWTIGYGHTGPVHGKPIGKGMAITKETAEALFVADIDAFASGLYALLPLPPYLNPNQFGALVSLAYNIGLGNFATSSLLKHLYTRDLAKASAAFGLYVKAGGKTLKGLVTRRARERALFDAPWTARAPS
jgi:lysozyme